jgi:ParB-like chromosome segregation protein Spo0J
LRCNIVTGLEPTPPWLDVSQLLGQFAPERLLAQRRYRAFIRAGLENGAVAPPIESEIYLAERAYIRRLGGKPSASPEIPRLERQPIAVPLEQLLRANGDRAIVRAYRAGGYTLREIADVLGLHYSTVSRRLAAQEGERPPISLRCKT